MSQSGVLDSLKGHISREILEGRDIGLDASTPLLEWGIINSMEMARLVGFIEDQFGVRVPDDKITIEHFKDLNAIANLVLQLGKARSA